jgi:hypothetical protein
MFMPVPSTTPFCLLNSGPSPELVFVEQGETRTILLQPVYEDLVKAAMP